MEAPAERIDPGIYPWTFACLAWPAAILCPCCLPEPGLYVWGPLAGVALVVALPLAVLQLARGQRPSEFTRRALLFVGLQSLLVALAAGVTLGLRR